MTSFVKMEGKCNESVNNEFKIMRKSHTSNNESDQILKQTQRLFNYFFNSLF